MKMCNVLNLSIESMIGLVNVITMSQLHWPHAYEWTLQDTLGVWGGSHSLRNTKD